MSYIKTLQEYLAENNCAIDSITASSNHNIVSSEQASELILEFIQAPTVEDAEFF
jgi:hypothetical protein